MKKILILFLILTFAVMAFGQGKYKTYSNARFGYSISYPSDLLTPQGEADNGDGQVFTGDGAEVRVFGSNLLLNESLLKEFNALVAKHGRSVRYKTYQKNFFVVSALPGSKIFYQKTMKNASGQYLTFMIEYNESKRDIYDPVVTRMVKSFK